MSEATNLAWIAAAAPTVAIIASGIVSHFNSKRQIKEQTKAITAKVEEKTDAVDTKLVAISANVDGNLTAANTKIDSLESTVKVLLELIKKNGGKVNDHPKA